MISSVEWYFSYRECLQEWLVPPSDESMSNPVVIMWNDVEAIIFYENGNVLEIEKR